MGVSWIGVTLLSTKPILIDCRYVFPKYAAAYLIVEKKRALFVENNTSHAVLILLDELAKAGLKPTQVEYLIVTHAHLDHAGGSSALIQACPNATLLAHPRAAKHLIDPSKLIQGARQVYGDQVFEELYGQIDPIPANRVREIQDGEEIEFGSRLLRFFYTRGHAKHHFCVFDSRANGVFTGDSFGIAYPALQRKGLFIFPSTSPVDFEPNEARISIQKIMDSGAERAYLTHFGEVGEMSQAAGQLLGHLDFHEKLLDRVVSSNLDDKEKLSFCQKELNSYFHEKLSLIGLGSDSLLWDILRPDIELNAAGLVYASQKRKTA